METLRIGFVDVWPEFHNDENIFLPILKKHFNVEVTTVNPEVILHSTFGGMKEVQKYSCKKILFLGENHRAAQFKSDFSISFDPETETNYRLPLWQFFLLLRPELKESLFGQRVNHEKFDKWGSFTVSNPSNFFRNAFYDALRLDSSMQVFSYGRYKTNSFELQKASQGKYWRDAKHEFFLKNRHKYCICFENSSYPYYCTEKLMDAFLEGSLPVYWGDPKAFEDWNKDAFIHVGRIGQQAAIDQIRHMEKDENLFNEKYSQPVFTEEQKARHIYNIEGFENWLVSIIKK
jgi:alpha(1,3/1,4) fucosyltransferase